MASMRRATAAAGGSSVGAQREGAAQAPMQDFERLGNQAMMEQLQAQQGAAGGSREEIAAQGFSGRPGKVPFLSMMEAAFGQSFGEVRAYTDAPAQTANQALGTEGYMMGEQVAFGSASPSKDVVAHELAHVVQQTAGGPGGAVDAETDAHAAAEAVLSGAPVQVLARAPYGSLMLWDSYEHKAFGNLAVIKADGGNAPLPQAGNALPIPKNDPGLAAIDRQAEGATRVDTNDSWVATGEYSPPVAVPNSITFGDASELSGDYARDPQELAQRQTGDTGGGPIDFYTMVSIAQTNVNHFYPLCGNEYTRHHQLAVAAARAGDRRTAMLEEGFASHFLQDCFAAGHMAPRALDRVSVGTQGESELGLNRSKKWHDALNELTTGLPTTRGRFRGDDTMNSSDLATISDDSAASLSEVMTILNGGQATPANIDIPRPDHSAIMADPDYGPLWRAMTGDYEADLRNAESQPRGQDQMTDGGTPYSTRDTAAAMRQNVWGGQSLAVTRVTRSEWNGATLVFNVTVDGRSAPVGTEIWVKWFDCDAGYDHHDSGNLAGEFTSPNATFVQDTDELLAGPDRVSLANEGLAAARSGNDDTGDTYAVFYANAECTVPIGRSHVQGTDRGQVNKPAQVSGFGWSSNTLSFDVSQGGQPMDGRSLYLKWFDCDSGYDHDARGNLTQSITDADDQLGGLYTVPVAAGRGRATATGAANNSGDTYGVVYLDQDANIPLGRSEVMP